MIERTRKATQRSRWLTRPEVRSALTAVAVTSMLVPTSLALASSHSDNATFTGCLDKSKLLDVAIGATDEPCEKGDRIHWQAQGVQGEIGSQGDVGPHGETGPVGPVGPQGTQGEQGVQGDRGEVRPQGPAGDVVPSRRWYGDQDGDDFDNTRFPGNIEVNDPYGIDEDCDVTTGGVVGYSHELPYPYFFVTGPGKHHQFPLSSPYRNDPR